ncbi:NAD(P)/FAD-dependent oxidoreductase [Shimia sagamensis]|uniref:Sarcosine oxidase n=1 Tax=Shimia sagamensis TaxID=1566352 RepID=A0ABY1NV63_9RHOB|nr:FAD-dependent oxidoreductase [Shimia sagamensis]SMP18947.1 sarcosine oxidase [Shimia sagamensis]
MGFDVIVVGAGMWGSACARHLAEMGATVALVGPVEPDHAASHEGVFASHYDEARITRRLDGDCDWSRAAAVSMDRYADIEEKGGVPFFHRVGALMAGPTRGAGSEYILNTKTVAEDEGIDHVALRGADLRAQFPYFDFPDGVLGLFEAAGGWINPRGHVSAEISAAVANGVTLVRDEVVDVQEDSDGVLVRCAGGGRLRSERVVVACGAFSKAADLLPEPVPLKVYARTIAFVEIDDSEADRLKDMPSVVYFFPNGAGDCYILPPVRYPDGKTYLKIGGDPDDVELTTAAEMKEWFRGGGDPKAGRYMAEQLFQLMPSLASQGVTFGSCATSFTPRGNPLIYGQTKRVFALTGGNGAGAKCADEIGRLGALKVMGKSLPENTYQTGFLP